ncbi:MAG: hypothetical protein H6563_09630 [Lewinellaceae bacterium]|nr:hypothetical protein [Lewinellaceae bacterium]
MTWLEKVQLVSHVLYWRFTWSRRHLDYKPGKTVSKKFISAREAARLFPDGATVFSSGIGGNARCTIFFFALRNRFQTSGHPNGLTWVNGGGQGSRGRVPGTVEEMGIPGLMKTYLAAHLETTKAQLRLGQARQLELHTIPQGVMSLLLEANGMGEQSLTTKVGLGTFLDPRSGRGSLVNPPGSTPSFVEADGDALRYTLPPIDIALMNVPYADEEGNLYFKHAATITENIPSIQAVRQNKGLVMASVSGIIPKSPGEISIPAQDVDYIVVNPYNEQSASVLQRNYWPLFTPEGTGDRKKGVQRLKFINNLLKITPVRSPLDQIMGRLAASIMVREVPKGGMVNIGIGFPEEVARLLVEHGLEEDYLFTTEAGSYGGLPAPGIFFGAAVNPQHLEPSSDMFHRYQTDLDVAVLGFLQVDSEGNVNVSKRGPDITDYVGPGGFMDITSGAHTIVFIGKWMHNAQFQVEGDEVHLLRPGKPKFVEEVDEITFNGREGVKAGKNIYYVTNVGLFQLTAEGLTLRAVFPGIDVGKDILMQSKAHIVVPPAGQIEVIDGGIVSGKGFRLEQEMREYA